MDYAKKYRLDCISFKKYCNSCTLSRCFITIFFVCIVVMINVGTTPCDRKINESKSNPVEKSKISDPHKSHGPPYLAFIISSMLARFNTTSTNLNSVLPGYFNIQHKQPVSTNDSRIMSGTSVSALSLLLTYIDLWNEIGAKAESELMDDDWIFLFEDDVNIVPLKFIPKLCSELNAKRNHSNLNISLAGSNRSFILRCIIHQKTIVNFFGE